MPTSSRPLGHFAEIPRPTLARRQLTFGMLDVCGSHRSGYDPADSQSSSIRSRTPSTVVCPVISPVIPGTYPSKKTA
jgi:hypothetical protein